MHATPTCFDCKTEAPETNTDYSLIGAQGWRVAQRALPDGGLSFEWRCPACWAKHKAARGITSRSSAPPEEGAPRSGPVSERRPPPDSARPSEQGPVSSKRSGVPDSKKPRSA